MQNVADTDIDNVATLVTSEMQAWERIITLVEHVFTDSEKYEPTKESSCRYLIAYVSNMMRSQDLLATDLEKCTWIRVRVRDQLSHYVSLKNKN